MKWSAPPSSFSNGALKPLRGSYLQREELSSTFKPRSTLWLPLYDLSLAPAKTAALRLSDRALITDHQAQWTLNLNQGAPWQTAATFFLALLAQKFLSMFSMSRHVQRTGWRDSTVCTVCHQCLGLEERDRREADRASFNTLRKKIARAVQVRNVR